MDTQYWCHINAKSTDCTVLIPSLPYARGYAGRVTNDLGIIGVGLPYKNNIEHIISSLLR